MIEKIATNKNSFKGNVYFYNDARTALKEILCREKYKFSKVKLLLPAYIGYSTREGSGIFDPVIETGTDYDFYLLQSDLQIDENDLKSKIGQNDGHKIVLFVNYFGIPDEKIDNLEELCRSKGHTVVEDSAHALYTDLVDGKCGNYSDYKIYSMHKMLPYKGGGC